MVGLVGFTQSLFASYFGGCERWHDVLLELKEINDPSTLSWLYLSISHAYFWWKGKKKYGKNDCFVFSGVRRNNSKCHWKKKGALKNTVILFLKNKITFITSRSDKHENKLVCFSKCKLNFFIFLADWGLLSHHVFIFWEMSVKQPELFGQSNTYQTNE